MQGQFQNTILGTIIAVLGLGLVALWALPANPNIAIFLGLIVVVVNTLLGIRQAEANGHRITQAEGHIITQRAELETQSVDIAKNTAKIKKMNGG